MHMASSRYDPLRVLKVLYHQNEFIRGYASSRYDPLRVLKDRRVLAFAFATTRFIPVRPAEGIESSVEAKMHGDKQTSFIPVRPAEGIESG